MARKHGLTRREFVRLKSVFSIEYEHNWTSSLPEIAQCVAYFEQVAGELAAASSKKGKSQ
jgi:hypothetical protein